MEYKEFERIMSKKRMGRYLIACGGDYLNEPEIDTGYIVTEYQKIQSLFAWMNIDSRAMLYGLDHVLSTCGKINALK